MARRVHAEPEVAAGESFLDVTTNIVGILIVLVLVVGQHVKSLVFDVPAPAPNQQLQAVRTEASRLESSVHDLSAQMATVQNELKARAAERGQLSTWIAAIEHDIEGYRKALDERSRSRFDTERSLAEARDELARLQSERQSAEREAAPKTIEIENRPTPISKSVDGDEAHFRLAGGRLAFLPYEPLMNRLRHSLRDAINRMGDHSELVDTLGPMEGFRLRYVIQRQNTDQLTLFQLVYVEFIPVSNQLGEPVDEALAKGSDFRETLQILSPNRYTITVWTYPDSFAEFGKLKKELYRLGYSVAARPLPEGMPIGASPQGSRSAAE
jgi:hypothetical protein